jgi:hypothetical protein
MPCSSCQACHQHGQGDKKNTNKQPKWPKQIRSSSLKVRPKKTNIDIDNMLLQQ